MLVFTESRHQTDENGKSYEIDENTPDLAVRRALPHWSKVELSSRSVAEVRDALAYCFFSKMCFGLRGVTCVTSWGRGIISELRKLVVKDKFRKGWLNKKPRSSDSDISLFEQARSLILSVASPAEPRSEKNNFFLCKFWAVKNF